MRRISSPAGVVLMSAVTPTRRLTFRAALLDGSVGSVSLSRAKEPTSDDWPSKANLGGPFTSNSLDATPLVPTGSQHKPLSA
jgi:hypothetical protein